MIMVFPWMFGALYKLTVIIILFRYNIHCIHTYTYMCLYRYHFQMASRNIVGNDSNDNNLESNDNNHSNDNKEYLYCALFHRTFGLYIVHAGLQDCNNGNDMRQ